ncbi:MAG: type II toxin-antitoxin system RelE/ParE family toxin [Clostridiales bacterium]|nr:type II toxin-antitoxin system RelE/ParE family toxin [Clostridiales bacterium]
MYEIFLKKRAKKFIDKLPQNEKIRLVREIEKLPYGSDIKPLKGYKGFMRLRVGDYRIIYTVDHGNCIVWVVDVDNRGEIYKRY